MTALEQALHELRRRAVRSTKRLVRPLWMRWLLRRNASCDETLLDPLGPVVTLTTYGPRLASVLYTIESIGAGRFRPSRLQLWIDGALMHAGLPESLRRLQRRGLEVHGCQDVGPHTKYLPAVRSLPHDRALVTADDDTLYGRQWLADLAAAAQRAPELIHCHRAHVIAFDADGRLLPYARWPSCRSVQPSHRHFLTGVAGVIYPPAMQRALREAGDAFLACSPRADDIWLNAIAWRTRTPVQQVRAFHPVQFELPGTRSQGLAGDNVQGGANDRQLLATYSTADLLALRAAP